MENNEVMNTEVVEETAVEELETLAACEEQPEEEKTSKVGLGIGVLIGSLAIYGAVKTFQDGKKLYKKLDAKHKEKKEKRKAEKEAKKSAKNETEAVDAEVELVEEETSEESEN